MEIPIDWLETVLRLVLATVLTAMIGLEREVRNKAAGLRTHMLVGLGSAAFGVFSLSLVEQFDAAQQSVMLDPMRIIEGIIGGLGFLGAGAIIQSRGDVHGMTTAAGIWIAGAIGIGCGIGSYFAVIIVTLIALICLIPVRMLESKVHTNGPDVSD